MPVSNQDYYFEFSPDRCLACFECEEICPTNAIDISSAGITHPNGQYTPTNYYFEWDPYSCTYCGDCDLVCPEDAIYVDGPPDPGVEDPDEDPGGAPGGGGTGPDFTPIPTPPKLQNEMVDPCLTTAFTLAFGGSQMNTILDVFQDVIGTADGFDVYFQQGHLGPGTWADTQMFRNGTAPNYSYYFYITMNLDVIQNASGYAAQEAIVATMYHELLHTIFESRKILENSDLGWSETFQHQIMATAYTDQLTSILTQLFPGLSASDAKALSWEGLQDTQAWQSFANQYPVEANQMALDSDQFDATGSKGTRCP